MYGVLNFISSSLQDGSGPDRELYIPEPQQNRASMDIDFDMKTADDYQSIGELNVKSKYEDVDGFEKTPPPLQPHSYKFYVILTFLIAVLALLVGAGGLGIGLYNWLFAPESATVMDLQKQLRESQATIDQLTTSIAELRTALHPNNNSTDENSIESLVARVDAFSVALEDIVPLNELELYTNCTIQRSRCSVGTVSLSSPPTFSECTTSVIPHTSEDYQNINVHCAITDSREERNPMVATLNVNEDANEMSCSCYVIDLGSDRNPIECSLIVERCPN